MFLIDMDSTGCHRSATAADERQCPLLRGLPRRRRRRRRSAGDAARDGRRPDQSLERARRFCRRAAAAVRNLPAADAPGPSSAVARIDRSDVRLADAYARARIGELLVQHVKESNSPVLGRRARRSSSCFATELDWRPAQLAGVRAGPSMSGRRRQLGPLRLVAGRARRSAPRIAGGTDEIQGTSWPKSGLPRASYADAGGTRAARNDDGRGLTIGDQSGIATRRPADLRQRADGRRRHHAPDVQGSGRVDVSRLRQVLRLASRQQRPVLRHSHDARRVARAGGAAAHLELPDDLHRALAADADDGRQSHASGPARCTRTE